MGLLSHGLFFTNPAIELALSNDVKLFDRNALIRFMLEINPLGLPTAREVREQIPSLDVRCPKCGGEMILRKGSYGSFYGCSQFPKCNGTKRI